MSSALLVGVWYKWDGMRPKISLFRVIRGRGRRYCTRCISTGGAVRSYVLPVDDSVKASFRLEANSILTLQPLTDDLGRKSKIRKRNKKIVVNLHYFFSFPCQPPLLHFNARTHTLATPLKNDNLDWVSDPCVKSGTAPPSVVVSASPSNRRCRRRAQSLCFTLSVPPPWAPSYILWTRRRVLWAEI